MKSPVRPSLFKRLAGIHALALIGTWILTLGWMALEATRFGVGDFDQALRVFPETLAQYAEAEVHPEKLAEVARVLDDANRRNGSQVMPPGERYVNLLQVWNDSGRLIYRSPEAPAQPLSEGPGGFSWAWVHRESWRVFSVTTGNGKVRIQSAESLATRRTIMMYIGKLLLSSLYWVLPIGILITWMGTRNGLRPLARLAKELASRSPRDMEAIRCEPEVAETTPVVDAMNQLLARLKTSLESQQRFLGDAAHELRTPLAVIGAQAHVLVGARGREEASEALEELERGLERASHLVNRLLTVARLESDGFEPHWVHIRLEAEVRKWLASANDLAEEKGIDISLESGESHVVTTDPECLRHAFDNLVENAILHGNASGKIVVTVDAREGEIVVRVADDGPGIPMAERDRLFQRFQRGRGVSVPGSGLGLAIVSRTMDLLGGSVTLSEGLNERGIAFELHLPMHPADLPPAV